MTLAPKDFEDLWRDTKEGFDVSWTEAWLMVYETRPEDADAYLAYRIENLMPEINAFLELQDPPFGG